VRVHWVEFVRGGIWINRAGFDYLVHLVPPGGAAR
jgi:hypothetical protein